MNNSCESQIVTGYKWHGWEPKGLSACPHSVTSRLELQAISHTHWDALFLCFNHLQNETSPKRYSLRFCKENIHYCRDILTKTMQTHKLCVQLCVCLLVKHTRALSSWTLSPGWFHALSVFCMLQKNHFQYFKGRWHTILKRVTGDKIHCLNMFCDEFILTRLQKFYMLHIHIITGIWKEDTVLITLPLFSMTEHFQLYVSNLWNLEC